jgi:probable LLM family oxidoreductase
MEIGITTLGEILTDPRTGRAISPQERMEEILKAAELADQGGLDVFAIGEHHRLDFIVSAVPVVLAAIAQRTRKIRLSSAVTVLSTADPVREYQNFATLDLLSNGRAEMIAGRGAFIESFPLFGYKLEDYEELFPEALELLMKCLAEERVTWKGKHRPPLNNAEIAPRMVQKDFPLWIGVGGTPQSIANTAILGLPMILGIIGGSAAQFAPLMDYYRQVGEQSGWTPDRLKTGVNSYLHLATDAQAARDTFYPYHAHYFGELSKGRGQRMSLSRSEFDRATRLEGAYFIGSPQQVIDKLLYQHELFGHQRFMAQIDLGGLPFTKVAETIELLATQVAPVVSKAAH